MTRVYCDKTTKVRITRFSRESSVKSSLNLVIYVVLTFHNHSWSGGVCLHGCCYLFIVSISNFSLLEGGSLCMLCAVNIELNKYRIFLSRSMAVKFSS